MPHVMVAMCHLFLVLSCLFWSVLRERANYGSRVCQFPISHARLWSPSAAFCLGRLSYSKLWQSLRVCPPNKSGPCISQPILTLLCIRRGSQCPPSILPGLPTYPMPKVEVAWALMVHFSLVYAPPCAPKSKWHVPPPAYGFAYGSYSQLCQSLSPPNGSKPM